MASWVAAICILAAGYFVIYRLAAVIERKTGKSRRVPSNPKSALAWFVAILVILAPVSLLHKADGPLMYALIGLAAGFGSLLGQLLFGQPVKSNEGADA